MKVTLYNHCGCGFGSEKIFKFLEAGLLERDMSHSPRKHLYLMAWSFAKAHPQSVAALKKIFRNIESQGWSKFGRRERTDLKLIKSTLGHTV